MPHAARIAVVFACAIALGAGKPKSADNINPPSGAWLETHLKWEHPPSSIDPQLQTSRAMILYFGEDHTFAKLMCVVVRVPGEPITINDDADLILWRGQWNADRKGVAVWYYFVVPRERQWPEGFDMGQTIESTIIRRSHDQLNFAHMNFERESELDDDALRATLTNSAAIKLPTDE